MTADVGARATDAELVARFRSDPEKFSGVYDRYRRDVYRYVAGRLDRQTADDTGAGRPGIIRRWLAAGRSRRLPATRTGSSVPSPPGVCSRSWPGR